MSRNYNANSIIDLPRLGSQHALTLGSQVLNAVPADQLPPLVQRPYVRVKDVWEGLRKTLGVGSDPAQIPTAKDADYQSDQAWAALDEYLTSWSRMPPTVPQSQKARTLREVIYPQGRTFTRLDFRSEWGECEWRVAKLAEEANTALVEAVGATPFVARIREAHQVLGEALGMKKERPEVRESLESFCSALRSYILHVAVHAESGEPGAEELAEKLLAPVVEWKSKQANPQTAADVEPEPKPTDPA